MKTRILEALIKYSTYRLIFEVFSFSRKMLVKICELCSFLCELCSRGYFLKQKLVQWQAQSMVGNLGRQGSRTYANTTAKERIPHMRKRLLSFVLAVLMIASLLPATALAAVAAASGTCGAEGDGSNLTWTYADHQRHRRDGKLFFR